jgi:subtilisin family serine protease
MDTGIDINDPELNVVGGTSCFPHLSPFEDDFGHGTHVAGIIGAADDGHGVVGVAPGVRLWSMRVYALGDYNNTSRLLCAVDKITEMRRDADPGNDIEVVNMSLANGRADDGACGRLNEDPLHMAMCEAEESGVLFVVAAGNERADIRHRNPASYDEVLTVTAMADLDGVPGGDGDGRCGGHRRRDDVVAHFSNFARLPADRRHTIAAPGVCVLSNWPGGISGPAVNYLSGTSMSSPTVAGIAALCIDAGACGQNPARSIRTIRSRSIELGRLEPRSGFTGDPSQGTQRYYGYLARADAF